MRGNPGWVNSTDMNGTFG